MQKILEVLASIGFDWKVALANFVNFLIVYYFLNRFIFSRIRDVLSNRKKAIERGLEDAKMAEKALLSAKEEEKVILNMARIEANNIITTANHHGNHLIGIAEEKGRKEALQILGKAEDGAKKMKEEALLEIEQEAVSLILDGTYKLLTEEFEKGSIQKNDDYIKNLIKKSKVSV